MKVAIIGSRRYENKKKIKDFIFKLKNEYGTDTIIVSGGCKQGADRYAKKYALELGLQYEEYPPFHEVHNLYCTMPSSRYGKPYSMKNWSSLMMFNNEHHYLDKLSIDAINTERVGGCTHSNGCLMKSLI